MSPPRTAWVVARDGGATLECKRCGTASHVALPISVTAWAEKAEEFRAMHARCLAPEADAQP